ncbi:Bug family tripartite tricarboxylate transporter substrate binding protein [Pollutimonas sp. M17]|uniref:Bug family tripartite tricarboxylate transporter substrate binding protein n=1 Tax=Pollutimonas sp. M17 TaxID=2962065 RepID=UPI0021F44788|nr:tripartite tricarboxylate transporter substrate binding protein [Pollutimonas sp. M17]UYO93565.1 tripartite tricarboxylate transporter substrate binding protein [Pollutimonas sp. M17]
MAQGYPSKSIRMIIPAAPGGGVDSAGRILGQYLSEKLGQSVVTENVAGAGTMLGSETLARSQPDGYTILMATSSHIVNAAVRRTMRYDAIGDFAAVSLVGSTPDLLVVNADSSIKSVADLIAAAKKDPGKLTYGSSGLGTLSQLEPEMLKDETGIDILGVPYRGGVPAVMAVIGKEVDSLFLGVVALAPHIDAGKLRPLAVTSPARLPRFPDVPTMAESGFPDWNTDTWYGVLVPAGTSPDIIATLNKHINDALKLPEIRQKLVAAGIGPEASTPDQFSSIMKNDLARWQKVIEKLPELKID